MRKYPGRVGRGGNDDVVDDDDVVVDVALLPPSTNVSSENCSNLCRTLQ